MENLYTLVTDPAAWIAFTALAAIEIVLGIDNPIFISVLTNKLPVQHRPAERRASFGDTLVLRLILLDTLASSVKLTESRVKVFETNL